MNLSADRLAKLAGLPVAEKRNLNEASNRSMHEDPALAGEDEHRFGKGQLAEEQKYGGNKGDESRSRRDFEEGHYMEEDGHAAMEEDSFNEGEYGGNKGDESKSRRDYMEEDGHDAMEERQKYGGNKGDESRSKRDYMGETVEVNEEMIAREIALMRKERLQENELRKIIRAEIGSIMKGIKQESSEAKTTKRSDNLRSGITMGMLGPGFR